MPSDHAQRMEELRSLALKFDVNYIYNQDESGLLYRMGPNRSYLSSSESRSEIGAPRSKAEAANHNRLLCERYWVP